MRTDYHADGQETRRYSSLQLIFSFLMARQHHVCAPRRQPRSLKYIFLRIEKPNISVHLSKFLPFDPLKSLPGKKPRNPPNTP
jgi:hypothetical protein